MDCAGNSTYFERDEMNTKALETARLRRQEKIAAGEKIERTDPIEKAAKNPKSLRLAINAKCWDCQGGETPGTRQRIRTCECGKHCSLFAVRPYQGKVEEVENGEDIDFDDL